MGIFNIIMTAMGFEGEPKKPKKEKKPKQQPQTSKTAKFNLGQKQEQKPKKEINVLEAEPTETSSKDVNFYTPKTQREVQKICDNLAEGDVALIDLTNFADEEMIRAVDFLSGVAYILKYKIQRMGNTVFFVGPENVEPMEYVE